MKWSKMMPKVATCSTDSAKACFEVLAWGRLPLVTGRGSFPLGALMCLAQRVPVQSEKNQLVANVDLPGRRDLGTLPVWISIHGKISNLSSCLCSRYACTPRANKLSEFFLANMYRDSAGSMQWMCDGE